MLNTKQRAQLRALANPLAVTLIIGKEGVTEAVERELDALLESHELVKGKVLESAMLTPRTVSEALCEATGAEFIHPFDDEDVMAGQGTIALEILRDLPFVDMNTRRNVQSAASRPSARRRAGA